MSAALDTASPPNEDLPINAVRTRSFYWSVRRELWENRFLYIAPVAVAAVFMLAFATALVHLPHFLLVHPHKPGAAPPPPGLTYSIEDIALILTGVIVGAFYCLGALYSERRDRSILFWKSLPVSDTIAILAKASIPLIILPAIIFAVSTAMQLVMLGMTDAAELINGETFPASWTQWKLLQMTLVLLYGLVTLSLWQAPLYAWLLMVSAWARRGPFLWAVLPPIALCLGEKIAFDTSAFSTMLGNRLIGSFSAAFDAAGQTEPTAIQLSQLTPMKFLSTPDLWVGLLFAAVFLAAAIRLRRTRGQL
jgi:ABC-2 type transport system permease protein